MANEPIQGAPYPLSTGAADVPTDIKALADWAAPRIVMRFASMTALTAAVTSPFQGQLAWTTDHNILWWWNSTKWRLGNIPEFATTTARDAAITAPTANDRCRVGSGSTWTEYTYTGSAWTAGAWIAYTPTTTNITKGTGGTLTGAYWQDGKTVHARGTFTFGTGSAVGSAPTFSLPAASVGNAVGTVFIIDSGSRYYHGVCFAGVGNGSVIFTLPTADPNITATSPMTWAPGDVLSWSLTYEVA